MSNEQIDLELTIARSGFTVAGLAGQMNVHRSTVYRWISRTASPSAAQLARLGVELGLGDREVAALARWFGAGQGVTP